MVAKTFFSRSFLNHKIGFDAELFRKFFDRNAFGDGNFAAGGGSKIARRSGHDRGDFLLEPHVCAADHGCRAWLDAGAVDRARAWAAPDRGADWWDASGARHHRDHRDGVVARQGHREYIRRQCPADQGRA